MIVPAGGPVARIQHVARPARGIDVSNVNGPVDWAKVAHADIEFAFVKATEGVSFDDSRFAANRLAARGHGVHVGAYHFARPDHNHPVDEARHLIRAVRTLAVGDLKPVLDYETKSSLSPAQVALWIREFNHEIRDGLGVWPIFYSYRALVQSLHLVKPLGGGFWDADYSVNDGHEHSFIVPTPWRRVLAHQFTSRGHVDGVPGDVDISSTANLLSLLAHPVRSL